MLSVFKASSGNFTLPLSSLDPLMGDCTSVDVQFSGCVAFQFHEGWMDRKRLSMVLKWFLYSLSFSSGLVSMFH